MRIAASRRTRKKEGAAEPQRRRRLTRGFLLPPHIGFRQNNR
jgi:hypothetical protein